MAAHAPEPAHTRPISIAVHGGAWTIPEHLRERAAVCVRAAATAGYAILAAGGRAMDAVEAAIRVLEDDPVFDAGYGSVLNSEGRVEMDALLIDGKTLKSGAVIGVDCVKNPITLARRVMERTPHAILAGEGARRFAQDCGVELVDGESLVTEEALAEWRGMKSYADTLRTSFRNPKAGPSASSETSATSAEGFAPLGNGERDHDTVGAVALDVHGQVASGTSTGGITMKMVGRVGDSPLFGCGGYADTMEGAASTTGHGESIIKVMLARRAVDNLQGAVPTSDINDKNQPELPRVQAAAASAIRYMQTRVDGFGGVILLAPNGDVSVAHNTAGMAWAAAVGRAPTDAASAPASPSLDATAAPAPSTLVYGVSAADAPRSACADELSSAAVLQAQAESE